MMKQLNQMNVEYFLHQWTLKLIPLFRQDVQVKMFFFSIHWFETTVKWVDPGMKPLFLNKFMSGRRPRMNLWKNKGFMTGLTNFWLRKWIENKDFLNFSTIYEMLIALNFSKRFFCLFCLCWEFYIQKRNLGGRVIFINRVAR